MLLQLFVAEGHPLPLSMGRRTRHPTHHPRKVILWKLPKSVTPHHWGTKPRTQKCLAKKSCDAISGDSSDCTSIWYALRCSWYGYLHHCIRWFSIPTWCFGRLRSATEHCMSHSLAVQLLPNTHIRSFILDIGTSDACSHNCVLGGGFSQPKKSEFFLTVCTIVSRMLCGNQSKEPQGNE